MSASTLLPDVNGWRAFCNLCGKTGVAVSPAPSFLILISKKGYTVGNMKRSMIIACACLIAVTSASFAQTYSTWNGGLGNWNNPQMWTPEGVPNGSGFNVLIDDGNASNSEVNINSGQFYSVDSVTVDVGDVLQLNNNSGLSILADGFIVNNGEIFLTTLGNNINIRIPDANGVVLSGAGVITLGGLAETCRILDSVGNANGVLTNIDSKIQGKGQLGVNDLQVINQAAGLIEANDFTGSLTLDARAANPMINFGTMRASSGGNLVLTGSGGGGFDNTGGTIEAVAMSTVTLTVGASITGGTLQTSDDGAIQVAANQPASLTDVTIDGNFTVPNNATLYLAGTITNLGDSFQVINQGNASNIYIDDTTVTLDGGGTIVLGGLADLSRIADLSGSALGVLNNVDNIIQGKGQIGVNSLQVINEPAGVIDANDSSGTLELDPRTTEPMMNEGFMRASNGGQLVFTGSGGGVFDNTGGTIEALATSTATLTVSASISGGILQTSDDGMIQVAANQPASLTDLTIDGNFTVSNNATLYLAGTITNLGDSFQVINQGNASNIYIDDTTVTLDGGGTIVLGGLADLSRIADLSGSALGVLNNVDNIIQGKGQIGVNSLQVINEPAGVIDANDSSGTLELDPRTTGPMMNEGFMRASNGGQLVFTGSGGGVFDNTGGTIEALASSTVTLAAGASISGGILQTSDDGMIQVAANQSASLTDLTIDGNFTVPNNATLYLAGTITNLGNSFQVDNNGNASNIYVNDVTATLNGGGTITLGGLANLSRIADLSGGALGVLDNVDNIIQGQGQIGVNSLQVDQRTGWID